MRVADGRGASLCLAAFEKKVPYLLRFFADEDDDVSLAVCPFTYEYIATVKQLNPMSDQQKNNVVQVDSMLPGTTPYSVIIRRTGTDR